MKNKFLSKLLSVTLGIGTILFPLTANATTFYSDYFMGTNDETEAFYLGDGTRYLYGTGYGSGFGEAMQVKEFAPDVRVAKITLTPDRYKETSFTANSTVDDDDLATEQSYYIRWRGNNSSSYAWLAISD